MKILLALLIFSAIVLFHEFGHFLLAKLNRITVVEFSLGMGPRLLSFEKGGTRYSWKLLPFGGSCMMLGEDLADQQEGAFGSKSVWARISVIAAGPIFNFILAYLLAFIIISCAGVDKPEVLEVRDGTPAAEAGIEAGDQITSINGKRMFFYRDISNYVTFHQDEMAEGKQLKVTWVTQAGEKKSAALTPVKNESGRYVIGISGSANNRVKVSVPGAAGYSACEVGYWVGLVFESLKMMVTGDVSLDDVSGPVGVVDMIGDTYEQSKSDGAYYVWLNMLNISVLLSANLGVMNLLPLPALDGGRLLFLFLELIRRKRLNPDIEGRIHLVGLALLMLLMIVIMYNDVTKMIG